MEKMYEKDALLDAIRKAGEAADELMCEPDVGTYNFDTPAIRLPDDFDISYFRTRECNECNGFTLERITDGAWQGYYWINGLCNGMQMRRTMQAEAVADSLKEQGYKAAVYYQMD